MPRGVQDRREKAALEAARALERECSPMRSRLEELIQTYGLKDDGGIGLRLARVDVDLYRNLLSLAGEGLEIVRRYRSHFPRLSLYSDGMLWYRLFEVINAAGGRIWRDKDEVNIPSDTLTALALLLVETSWFSTSTGGDIEIRNLEALASTILAYGGSGLEADLQRRAHAMRVKRVAKFLGEAMRLVAEYRNGARIG